MKNGGGAKKKEKNKKETSKLSNTYTNKVEKGLHTLSLEEEEKWQGGGHQGEQASQQWGQTHLGAKGDHFQHEEHQKGLDPKREVRSPTDFGEFGDLV